MLKEDRLIFEALADIDALTLTIYGEARGESWEGKLAVAYVILNRCRLWNKGMKHVVYAKNQFSCYLSSDPNYKILLGLAKDWHRGHIIKDTLEECMRAAEDAMVAPEESNVEDATFYRVKGTKNIWFSEAIEDGKLVFIKQIGHHRFFREAK